MGLRIVSNAPGEPGRFPPLSAGNPRPFLVRFYPKSLPAPGLRAATCPDRRRSVGFGRAKTDRGPRTRCRRRRRSSRRAVTGARRMPLRKCPAAKYRAPGLPTRRGPAARPRARAASRAHAPANRRDARAGTRRHAAAIRSRTAPAVTSLRKPTRSSVDPTSRAAVLAGNEVRVLGLDHAGQRSGRRAAGPRSVRGPARRDGRAPRVERRPGPRRVHDGVAVEFPAVRLDPAAASRDQAQAPRRRPEKETGTPRRSAGAPQGPREPPRIDDPVLRKEKTVAHLRRCQRLPSAPGSAAASTRSTACPAPAAANGTGLRTDAPPDGKHRGGSPFFLQPTSIPVSRLELGGELGIERPGSRPPGRREDRRQSLGLRSDQARRGARTPRRPAAARSMTVTELPRPASSRASDDTDDTAADDDDGPGGGHRRRDPNASRAIRARRPRRERSRGCAGERTGDRQEARRPLRERAPRAAEKSRDGRPARAPARASAPTAEAARSTGVVRCRFTCAIESARTFSEPDLERHVRGAEATPG